MIGKYSNNAKSILTADFNAVDTVLSITPLDVAKFPSISETWDYFKLILRDVASDKYEIVKVISITGSDFTVLRAQEGTTSEDWLANNEIYLGVTEENLKNIRAEGSGGNEVVKSANFVLNPDEVANVIRMDTAGIVATFAEMSKFEDFVMLRFKNTSGGDVALNPFGTESIEGEGGFIIAPHKSVTVYKDTTEWKVFSYTANITTLGNEFRYIQGLMCTYSDVDSIFITPGKCSSWDGSESFETTATMTADVNHDFNTGDGGLPLFVTKTGTFSSVGTAIVGTGTLFTTEFKVGDVLHSTSNGHRRQIITISNDTSMVVSHAYPVNVSGDAVIKAFNAPFGTLHAYLMYNSTLDTYRVGFDTQPNAENLHVDTWCIANGFVPKRRIGSVVLNSSAQLDIFRSLETEGGIESRYVANIEDISGAISYQLVNVSVPSGLIKLKGLFQARTSNNASPATCRLANYDGTQSTARVGYSGDAGFVRSLFVGNNSQIYISMSGTVNTYLNTLGYIDSRN